METNVMHQAVETGRTWFDAAYSTSVQFQDQGEQLFRSYVHQTPWFDENTKKTVDVWLNSYKQGRDAIKKTMDESFNNMEKMFNAMTPEK